MPGHLHNPISMVTTIKRGRIVANDYGIRNGNAITRTKRTGTVVTEMAVAVFDPSANTAQRPVGAYGLGVYLPAKAIIKRIFVDVVTTFTSAGADAGTIAIHAQAADDIIAAIAISDASNVWDAGIHGSKVGFPNLGADAAHDSALEVAALFAATAVKTTAIREITATVAVQALTAGKANIFVEYVISD
jgi:hypothetical protein